MPIVEVNGQNVQFPDNMSNDDIAAAIKKSTAPPETPSMDETLSPRSANSANSDISLSQVPGQVIKNLEDMASMPGRAFVGLSHGAGALMQGKGLSGAYNEAKANMANPQADPNAALPQRFVENALKDPATPATLPIGGPEAGLAAKGLKGLSEAAVTGLKQGVVSAGVHQADNAANGQGADLGQAAAEVGGSALLGMGGKALSGLEGNSLKDAAARIQGTKVKINSPEFNSGASNDLYPKYDVFGNAAQVQDQWQGKIQDLAGQLKQTISQASNDPNNYVSRADIFDQARKNIAKYVKSNVGAAEVQGQLSKLEDKFDQAYPSGYMNLADAQTEKQFVGKSGDWIAQAGKMSGDPVAGASAQAYNSLYDAFKNEIQNKGGPGVKEINDQISDMIPMERAASKQVLVQNRKNPISLDDYIGGMWALSHAASGNVGPLAILGANMASKSPIVAKTLNTAGNFMLDNPVAAGVGNAIQSPATELAGRGLSQALRDYLFRQQDNK
jgi:hypothetical protein